MFKRTNINGDQYLDAQPTFDIRKYLSGKIVASGIVQDRKGNIIRRLDIDMVGTWQGDEGSLTEDFRYYDGEIHHRVWHIKDIGNGQYEGRADDIIGVAKGQNFGNAIRWQYVMEVPVKGRLINLTFDDWMWAMQNGVILNRSYMKKFGIQVAEITIFMRNLDHE